jgi:chorismate mutase
LFAFEQKPKTSSQNREPTASRFLFVGKDRVMPVRGIRGATVASENTVEAIRCATRELLLALVEANGVEIADIASVFFTTSPDLTAEYPALAARQLGWMDTALMCSQEVAVPNGLPLCIRVLIHWNTDKRQDALQHVYLGAATRLRPDRSR